MELRYRLLAGCVAASLLAACGGEDSGGGDYAGDGGYTATPTPSPTPTPTPSSSGSVATYVEGQIAGVALEDGLLRLQATNRGLYFLWSRDGAADKVVKLHGSPTGSNAWTAQEVGVDNIDDFAVTNPYAEADREISFYWAGYDDAAGKTKWGMYNANNGGIGISATLQGSPDVGFIELVAAGGREGTFTPQPWIVTKSLLGSNTYRIFQDDGHYTGANTVEDYFSTAANPALSEEPELILSDPDNPRLYVASGVTLRAYGPDVVEKTWTFPDTDFGGFTDMQWYDGDLFVAYGNHVFKYDGADWTTVATVSDAPYVGVLAGTFCISGGEIYLRNGKAVSIQNSTTRDWISKGTLSAADEANATILRSKITGTGVFCSPDAGQTVIYTATIENKIMMITPVS